MTPATLSDALNLLVSRATYAPSTLAQHQENVGYLIGFFGDRLLEEFEGDAGGELAHRFLDSELTGGDRPIRKKPGEKGFTQPRISYNTARIRLNTLRLALSEAHHSGALREMPKSWPIPRPGSHGHKRQVVREAGARRLHTRKFKSGWQVPLPEGSEPAGRPTLSTAMTWVEKVALIHQKSVSRIVTKNLWKKLLAWFGDRALADFDGPPGYVLAFSFVEAEQERGVKFVTITKHLKALRVVLLEAERRGAIAKVASWPKLPFDGEPRTRYLTREEYAAVRAKAYPRLRLWLDICLYTAMHTSDVDALRWGDIDLPNGLWLRRNSKNKRQCRPAWFPMPTALRAALVEAHAELVAPPGREELIVGPVSFRYPIKNICKALGIELFAPIDLRRTLATWWIEGGGPRDALKAWMGHVRTSFISERHYIKATAPMLASGIKALESPEVNP